jgi:hypothetical protein
MFFCEAISGSLEVVLTASILFVRTTCPYPYQRYPLRSHHISWVECIFHSISRQVTHMKSQVGMDIANNFGRTWRSWIIIMTMYYNVSLLPEISLYQRPIQFISSRFSNEEDANRALRLICKNWRPGHIDCALEDVTRFLYTWHWRQRTLGMHSVGNGPTYSADYAGAP